MQKLGSTLLGLSFIFMGVALFTAKSLPVLVPYFGGLSASCMLIWATIEIIDKIKKYNKSVNDKRTAYDACKKNLIDQKSQEILQKFDYLINHAYQDPGYRLVQVPRVDYYGMPAFLGTADIHLTLSWVLKKTKQLMNATVDQKESLITKINGKIDAYHNHQCIKLKQKIHNYEIESDYWKDSPSM